MELHPEPILISKPTDSPLPNRNGFVTDGTKDKKFQLKGPAYCWEYPRGVTLLPENDWISAVIQTYVKTCTSEEHQQLTKGGLYLRFLAYQDTQEGSPYIYGYLRAIDDCTYADHKEVLRLCPRNQVPVEVTLATYGLFIFVDRTAWENKEVTSLSLMFVD